MIPRVSVPAEAVSAALGAPATDAEPAPIAGAYASLTHAFRAAPARPGGLPTRIVVVPYADDAWTRAARAWLAWEAAVWVAFWRGVRARGPVGGRWSPPPLIDDPAGAVRTFDVATPAGALPALARPWLPWPSVAEADLPEEQIRDAWARGFGALALPGGVAAPVIPEDWRGLPDARRRLLTDGQQVVPTTWRAFDPRWAGFDGRRRRAA